MSIRFDASGDQILRTASLPNLNGVYSVGLWLYFMSRPAASAYRVIFALNDNSNDADYLALFGQGASDTRLLVGTDDGGSFNEVVGATNLSPNTWYHVGLIRSASNSLGGYLNGVSEATVTMAMAARTAATRMEISGLFGADYLNDRIAAVKVWTTNLAAAAIANEVYTLLPKALASLSIWSPCFPGATERLADYSGNGLNWTAGGTLTDEDHPPITWGALYRLPLTPATPEPPPSAATLGWFDVGLRQAGWFGGDLLLPGWFDDELVAAAAGGISEAIGLVTETDSAFALTALKSRALGLVTETDLAQALTVRRSYSLGQAVETDVAQALTVRRSYSIGLATETDLAQAVAWAPKIRQLGQAVETDLAQALTARKSRSLGLATETDLAQALTVFISRSIGPVSETDLAFALTARKSLAIGQASQTNIAQALARAKSLAIGLVVETDLAQALGRLKLLAIGLVAQTNIAQALVVRRSYSIGQASETDLAQALGKAKALAIGQASETDLAQAVTRVKALAIGPASQTNLAQALTLRRAYSLGLVTETALAQAVNPGGPKFVAIGFASETDLALALLFTAPILAAAVRAIQKQKSRRKKIDLIQDDDEDDILFLLEFL